MKVYVLVPAHNEENTIQEVISRIRKIDAIPIIIDDGSTDRTNELAKKSKTIVLRHEINKGKGEALKTAFNYILEKCKEAKYIVIVDADMQYLPEEAVRLLKPLEEGADFVTGYRNFKETPLRHRLGNFVWKNFFNIIFGTKFKDTNCGFMALKRKAVKKIKNIRGGYIIENSLFAEAIKNNLKIKQVPVTINYEKISETFRGIKIVTYVLIFIFKEGFKYRLGIK
jgi:glycosyltransferase involved in cell wall biosynthesis